MSQPESRFAGDDESEKRESDNETGNRTYLKCILASKPGHTSNGGFYKKTPGFLRGLLDENKKPNYLFLKHLISFLLLPKQFFFHFVPVWQSRIALPARWASIMDSTNYFSRNRLSRSG